MRRSWVWNFATRVGNKAYCSLCNDQSNNEFSCNGSTGAIGKHLVTIHKKTPTLSTPESRSHNFGSIALARKRYFGQARNGAFHGSVNSDAAVPTTKMADGSNENNEKEGALIALSTRKFRALAGADAQLIELVRSRRVLYDPSHARFMDNNLKNVIWIRIGKEVKASPQACKRRWYNIRDQYRKALRRRNLVGSKLTYKFASTLGFLDPFFKGQVIEDPLAAIATSTTQNQNSEDSNDFTEQNSTVDEATGEIAPQKTETNEDGDQSEADVMSNKSESVIDFDMFDKSANVSGSYSNSRANVSSNSLQSNVVDVFLAAIEPTLKGLSPYHLSLAKAEIFATVHKYELKGLVENGYAPDVDPLP